jgi:hypothetical protein
VLRRKKFPEEILAVCRQRVNAVFVGKFSISGDSTELTQPAKSKAVGGQSSGVRRKYASDRLRTFEKIGKNRWLIADSNL